MIRRFSTRAAIALALGATMLQAGCDLFGGRYRQFEIGFWNELGELSARLPIFAVETLIDLGVISAATVGA